MSWGKLLEPDLVMGGSILKLTPEIILQNNLLGLVLDVDETLVPIQETQASAQLAKWMEETKSVVSLWLVSNNLSEARIGSIAKSLNVPYLLGAAKPSRRKIKRAVEAMNLPPEKVAMVGDRLFTDVLAGNRLGMFTILVEPMLDANETVRKYPVHTFEVWVSKILGASFNVQK